MAINAAALSSEVFGLFAWVSRQVSFADGPSVAQVGYWLVSVGTLSRPLGNCFYKEHSRVEALHPAGRW